MLRDPRSEFDAAADVGVMSGGEEILSYERLLRRVASMRSRVIAAAVLAERRALNEPREILDRMCERASGLQRLLESEAGESADTGAPDASLRAPWGDLRHDARNAINVVACYADVLLGSLNGEADLEALLREIAHSLHLIEISLDAALAARNGPRVQENGVPWPHGVLPANGNEPPTMRPTPDGASGLNTFRNKF